MKTTEGAIHHLINRGSWQPIKGPRHGLVLVEACETTESAIHHMETGATDSPSKAPTLGKDPVEPNKTSHQIRLPQDTRHPNGEQYHHGQNPVGAYVTNAQ